MFRVLFRRKQYMQIQITGRNIEVTDALKTFIENKFSKLSRHSESILKLEIVLSVQKELHSAEAKVAMPGIDIVAEQSDKDMYAAIDILLDKTDQQILKHKEKITAKRRQKPKVTDEE